MHVGNEVGNVVGSVVGNILTFRNAAASASILLFLFGVAYLWIVEAQHWQCG